ncbi:hypothetical protein [Cyanobacterium aponinum]|uniref:hypothetical protein n=1 Tax=Cyanobacterium aponinum TaxID=379064 RepID=UPI0018ACB32D|nr:hypothetical protein [Cyanobacterium aponinum]
MSKIIRGINPQYTSQENSNCKVIIKKLYLIPQHPKPQFVPPHPLIPSSPYPRITPTPAT